MSCFPSTWEHDTCNGSNAIWKRPCCSGSLTSVGMKREEQRGKNEISIDKLDVMA